MKLSVLLPINRVDIYLKKCLRSIKDQTFKDFELVIIAPTSIHRDIRILANSVEILELHMIADPGGGLANALNIGIESCKGGYIARMDADDECEIQRFELQALALDSDKKIQVVATGAYIIDEVGKKISSRCIKKDKKIKLREMLFSNLLIHPSVMFRKDAIISHGLYRQNILAEDYDLWIRMLVKNAEILMLSKKLLRYRLHPGQLSFSSSSFMRCIQIANCIKDNAIRVAPIFGSIAWTSWIFRGLILKIRRAIASK